MYKKISIIIFLILALFIGLILISLASSRVKTLKLPNGLERSYRIHLPKGYTDSKKYPLVLAFHAYGDDPILMQLYTGLNKKADKEGFVVVYPYGTKSGFFSKRSWNAQICCGIAHDEKVDEVLFVSTLLDELNTNYSLESSKTYVVGFSNGGMLVHDLVQHLPNRISAAASVSSTIGSRPAGSEVTSIIENKGVSVPIIIFHSKDDGSVLFDGGESSDGSLEFLGAYDTVNYWLAINKCSKHPTELSKFNDYSVEKYMECETNNVLDFYILEKAGHAWPGGILDISKKLMRKSVPATNLIWEFFQRT